MAEDSENDAFIGENKGEKGHALAVCKQISWGPSKGTRDLEAAHKFIGKIAVSHDCGTWTQLEWEWRGHNRKWRGTLGMLILHGPNFSNSVSKSLLLTFLEMFPTNKCIAAFDTIYNID